MSEQDDRYRSRKWMLAQTSLWTIICFVAALEAASLLLLCFGPLEADNWASLAVDLLSPLTWGIGTVLTLYGGANVADKKWGSE